MHNKTKSNVAKIKFVKTVAKQILSDEKIVQYVQPHHFLDLTHMLVPLITNIEQIEEKDEELILIHNEHFEQFEKESSQLQNPFSQQQLRNELFSASFFTDENNKNISQITTTLEIISLPHSCQHYANSPSALLSTLLSALLRFYVFANIKETSNFGARTNT